MEDICRLCCSAKFVNNNIFDEENALYLKMSLYLPIKVFKNDRLPQKVCDRCSCKVNDFYQFCNETIEVQNRLRAVLASTAVEIEDSIDLTLIKHDDLSPPPVADHTEHQIDNSTDLKSDQNDHSSNLDNTILSKLQNMETVHEIKRISEMCDQCTQTDPPEANDTEVDKLFSNVRVKEEPKQDEVKTEHDDIGDNPFYATMQSDNSEDDMSLLQFQKKKRSKKTKVSNGDIDKRKRKKTELQPWDVLMRALPEGTALTVVNSEPDIQVKVKQELDVSLSGTRIKSEPLEFHCCVCFVQCYSRAEMLLHYREHAPRGEEAPPPAPPPPPGNPIKCARCQKRLETDEWDVHWQRHWLRDRRPLRCALCERTFRDHHQILKHGLTHKWGAEGAEALAGPEKRFVCDVCPDSFAHMRHLLAHRARDHPEAAARALALRCAVCSRQFAHLNSLRRHLRAHSGERNFLCAICGKALSSQEHLKFHVRIHTGYKPNVCKTCGKGFVKKCNLTLHERVHSGERPHVCAHCGKAFSQRSTLVIHERYHSGARPYRCKLCQRGFVAKGLLSMHLKTTCI